VSYYAKARDIVSHMELVTPATWSSYVSYLILSGIPLLMALPSTARIDALVEPRLSMLPVFTTVTTLLFAVYSLNFGPVHAKLKKPLREIQTSVLAHVVLLLVLSLPYWTVFQGISGHSIGRVVGALSYLVLYGSCWALGGLVIGVRWPSEIAQFNLKYALLIVGMLGTFFIVRPLNPLLTLSIWFGEGSPSEQWGFLLMGYGGLLLVVLALLMWVTILLSKREHLIEGGGIL
jgi:hypothetical protein